MGSCSSCLYRVQNAERNFILHENYDFTEANNNPPIIDFKPTTTVTSVNEGLYNQVQQITENKYKAITISKDTEVLNEKAKAINSFLAENSDEVKSSCENLREEYIKLTFTIIDSRAAQSFSQITITPTSINDIAKKLGDKFYFGRFDSINKVNRNDVNFNDEKCNVRQFEITYNQSQKAYYASDYKKGTGLFIKIQEKIKIDRDYIISFCSFHMVVQINVQNNQNLLQIKFPQGPLKDTEKLFDARKICLVRLGRDKNLEIQYKDNSISKIQCTFKFENDYWYIYDGSMEKPSTNGIWILASSKVKIEHDMILKTGSVCMLAKIEQLNK